MPLASATRDLIQSLIGRGWTEEDFATLILQQAQALHSRIANDSDPDGDPLTVSAVSQPAHGTASINSFTHPGSRRRHRGHRHNLGDSYRTNPSHSQLR